MSTPPGHARARLTLTPAVLAAGAIGLGGCSFGATPAPTAGSSPAATPTASASATSRPAPFTSSGVVTGSTASGATPPTSPLEAPPATRSLPAWPDRPGLTRSCPAVVFGPASENMASAITVTGVSCADAERLIRRVAAEHNVTGGPRRFSSGGFRCTQRYEDTAPPVGTYVCSKARVVVTWRKT